MKKRNCLFLTLLLLMSVVTSPLSVYSLANTEPPATVPEESLVVTQQLPEILQPEPQSLAGSVTLFNNISFSQYAVALPSTLTLGASFLSTVAAPIIIPAILGASVAYGSLQLGNQLGVMTSDLLQTSTGLRESLAADPTLQQELSGFALSGMESTTGTYNFSQNLQTRYAQDLTSHAIMREYLTGTGDYGAYGLSINDNINITRRYIDYNVLWSERERAAIIGRDASVASLPYANDQFFVLEGIRLAETSRGSNQTILEVVGRAYIETGDSQSFLYEKELSIPMTTALEQLTTLEAFLDYVQRTTTFTIGSISTPSKDEAIETAQKMAKQYQSRTKQVSEDLAKALAPSNNGLDFDPSGMIATLYGQAIVLNQAGQFIYATTKEAVPTYLWDAIEFSYSATAIPADDAITIDGRRGVLDEKNGDIIDEKTKKVLVKGAMGVTWTALSMKLIMDKIKEFKDPNNDEDDEDKAEWYTPLDLYYDEYFANGGKGHTIARHVGKTEKELKDRFEGRNLIYTSTFDNIVQALISINAGIFTANQNYLDGKTKLPLGDCSFDSQKNRIEYDSEDFLNVGWGIHKISKDKYDHYGSIGYAKVIIQKTNNKIRKNRKYYIVTAFPNLKRHANEIDPFISEAF